MQLLSLECAFPRSMPVLVIASFRQIITRSNGIEFSKHSKLLNRHDRVCSSIVRLLVGLTDQPSRGRMGLAIVSSLFCEGYPLDSKTSIIQLMLLIG